MVSQLAVSVLIQLLCVCLLLQAESILIARINPLMRVYARSGGQLALKGHCLCLPQDITQLVTVLPRLADDVSMLVVRRTNEATGRFHDLRVRRHKVQDALVWLPKHNPLYKDIQISNEQLEKLPEDGQLPVRTVEDDEVMPDFADGSVSTVHAVHALDDRGVPAVHGDPSDPEAVTEALLPIPANAQLESDAIRHAAVRTAVPGAASTDPLPFPNLGRSPVQEFETNAIVALSFPDLFPFGRGDPTNRHRKYKVEERDAVAWLLRYHDRRFARHPRFAFFMYNRLLRHHSRTQARFYLRNHPKDAHMTRAELKEKLSDDSGGANGLLSRMSRYVANIKGSIPWWSRRKYEVDALFEQKGPPTVFFTFRQVSLPTRDCRLKLTFSACFHLAPLIINGLTCIEFSEPKESLLRSAAPPSLPIQPSQISSFVRSLNSSWSSISPRLC